MKTFLFFLFIFVYSIKVIAQQHEITKALELFDAYSPKIEKTQKLIIQYRRSITGDLNNDGLTDIIIEFGLGEKGTNGIILKQAAIYINDKGTMKVIAGFEPDFCMNILSIENGIISVQQLESCILPNSEQKNIQITHYKLVDRKIVAIKK